MSQIQKYHHLSPLGMHEKRIYHVSEYYEHNSSAETLVHQRSDNDLTTATATTTLRPPPLPVREGIRHNNNMPAGVQRIRVLLAPYMSPYVIPLHKIQSWESLHRTLHAIIFGDKLSGAEKLRIKDFNGAIIHRSDWREFLEPNITIIVDAGDKKFRDSGSNMFIEQSMNHYTHQKPLSRPHYYSKPLSPQDTQYTPPHTPYNEKYSPKFIGSGSDAYSEMPSRYYGDMESATAMVLADRESEDNTYDKTPQTSAWFSLTAPPVLRSRPVTAWEGWNDDKQILPTPEFTTHTDERDTHTTVSILVGSKPRAHLGAVSPVPPLTLPGKDHQEDETIVTEWEMLIPNAGAAVDAMQMPQRSETKKKKSRPSFARIAQALTGVFCGGNRHKNSHTAYPSAISSADSQRPKTSPEAPPYAPQPSKTLDPQEPPPLTGAKTIKRYKSMASVALAAADTTPTAATAPQSSKRTNTPSISHRRGVPSPPLLDSVKTTVFEPPLPLAFLRETEAAASPKTQQPAPQTQQPKEVRRSCSLNQLLQSSTSAPALGCTVKRKVSTPLNSKPCLVTTSKKTAAPGGGGADSTISPPIPQRPTEGLGVNSQFKAPTMDRAQIAELALQAAQQGEVEGFTTGTWTRRGARDSTVPTLVDIEEKEEEDGLKEMKVPAATSKEDESEGKNRKCGGIQGKKKRGQGRCRSKGVGKKCHDRKLPLQPRLSLFPPPTSPLPMTPTTPGLPVPLPAADCRPPAVGVAAGGGYGVKGSERRRIGQEEWGMMTPQKMVVAGTGAGGW